MMIPQITPFEVHPFSIESSPYEENVVFYIKALGSWTERLLKLAEK